MTSPVRFAVLGLVFTALMAVLGIRLWAMQVTEAQAYEERADKNQVRVVFTPAPRGDIFDANGVKLAGTRSALAAEVDLGLVDAEDRDLLAQNLSAFLDVPASEITSILEDDNQGKQIIVARDLDDAAVTFLMEHREDFPGVNVVPQPVRTYPQGELAAHVIGYIGRPNDEDLQREDVQGNDFVGRAGVERTYDEFLQGTEGIVQYQVDAHRKVLALAAEESPRAGSNLILTIDSDVQAQLQASLRDGLTQARRLEMDERAAALTEASVEQRLTQALADARAEALVAARDAAASGDSTTTTTTIGADDDDVQVDPGPITVDPAEVLGPLFPGLPIDEDGMCVPVQRVTVPLGGDAALSGIEPRFVRLDAVDEQDGSFLASVTVAGEHHDVGENTSFGGTLQVLDISEDQIILYHKDKWCPVRSVGVVEDPSDGSIIAMSSYPTYDPSKFVGGVSTQDWETLGTQGAIQNFAVQGQYAPASTFKTVPYVLALEESYYPIDRGIGDKEFGDGQPQTSDGVDGGTSNESSALVPLRTDTDEYFCGGEFKFRLNDGTVQTKRDWKWPYSHGPLDLHGALQASCDLYFWDIALRLWNERGDESGMDKENLLQGYARSLGFGSATGIDLPFERDGLIPDRAWFISEQRAGSPRVRPDGPWVGGDLMDIAVGQGAVLATPLQMANSLAAMVNGGTVWQPHVVDQVVDQDGEVVSDIAPAILSRVELHPGTTRMLLQDLQQVVNNTDRGTARSAFANFGPGVELIGGKTGTGEVIKAPRSEHYQQVDNAFFVGVAPIDQPKYVISVVVERGGSGGRVAAPIARQVLQFLLNGADGVTELAPGLDAD